ncbi:uncharacterized protein [Onthophagus taurus]|uniref:uncharacterized protein n=1 Tax=Onthophagus taurus TaxID=166361 RepID=UPI0039BE0FD4
MALSKVTRAFYKTFAKRCLSTKSDFIKSSLPDVDIPRISLVEYVMKDFGKWGNKVAVECAETGNKYTYNDIQTKSFQLAKSLKNIKLQQNDVIALILPNIPEFPISILGSMLAGLRITTVNPSYTSTEIQRQLLDADAKAIITFGSVVENIQNAVKTTTKRTIPIITIKSSANEALPNNTISFSDLLTGNTKGFSENLLGFDDIVVMPYSSGTTGLPKGVELTNMNLVSNITQFLSPAYGYLEEASETHQDVLPAILPIYHIYGFTLQTLALLMKGCKIVTLSKFTPELYLKSIVNHKANILMVAPPVVMFLNSHPSVKKEHLQHIRSIMCGAAPLGASDENKIRDKVGHKLSIYQGLGLTETSPAIIMIPAHREGTVHGSIGHPFPNTTVKVVALEDNNLKHLGPNETGELLVKGPQVMAGYHNNPKETSAAFIDGWFRTGDMVKYNEDEMFFVADRIKELIKVKGYQVAPAELEETIRSFEGVAEAAVIGVPHPKFGEAPRAYIMPKQGVKIDLKKLNDYVKANLASYKQLEGGAVIVDMIPKNPSGKIMRRQLKLRFEENGF